MRFLASMWRGPGRRGRRCSRSGRTRRACGPSPGAAEAARRRPSSGSATPRWQVVQRSTRSLQVGQPDLLDGDRPARDAAAAFRLLARAMPSSAVTAAGSAGRPQRALGRRDRQDEEEEDARGGEKASQRERVVMSRVYPKTAEFQGQTSDQPGPRKKVPISVRIVATTTNQIMIHSGRVTRARRWRSAAPVAGAGAKAAQDEQDGRNDDGPACKAPDRRGHDQRRHRAPRATRSAAGATPRADRPSD